MSTFTSHLHTIAPAETTGSAAEATPVDMAALFRLLQDQFATLLADSPDGANRELLQRLAAQLEDEIRDPPRRVAGVTQEYLDGLDRVPKKRLRADDACPICVEKYLDDAYPLVVQLPCHASHRFDLECVGPWLLAKGSCPMCRTDLARKKDKAPAPAPGDDDEEDDYNMMIA